MDLQLKNEALALMEELNEKYFIEYYGETRFPIEFAPEISLQLFDAAFLIMLYINSVRFIPIEIVLFNSDNDDRIYYEETDSYEPLYDCIKRKYQNILEGMNKIKI